MGKWAARAAEIEPDSPQTVVVASEMAPTTQARARDEKQTHTSEPNDLTTKWEDGKSLLTYEQNDLTTKVEGVCPGCGQGWKPKFEGATKCGVCLFYEAIGGRP